MSAVTVSLSELENGLSSDVLEQAFGPDSLGIILVSDLPPHFPTLRKKVLTSISTLAHLPPQELEQLECEEAMWLAGWSRGKEKFKSGLPDYNKGSYYVNCAFHRDPALEGPEPQLADKFADFKTYTHPNVWPSKDLAGLEEFETDVKSLCNLIIDVAATVATNCDQFIKSHNKDYEDGILRRVVERSTCTKARLLHYYPAEENDLDSEWCGEHFDHSCLTGLTSALFMDQGKVLDGSPDPEAGLYIKNRRGETVKVSIPADCLAFQSGTAIQEISHDSLRAVSHFVRGSSMPGIARNTLAVFCQPDLDEMVNERENFASFASRILKENH